MAENLTGTSFFPLNDRCVVRGSSFRHRTDSKKRSKHDSVCRPPSEAWSTAAEASFIPFTPPPEEQHRAMELEAAIRSLQREIHRDRRKFRSVERSPPHSQYLLRVNVREGPLKSLPCRTSLDSAGTVREWLQAELLCQLTPLLSQATSAATGLSGSLCIGDLRHEQQALLQEVAELTRRLVHTTNKLLFCLKSSAGDRLSNPGALPDPHHGVEGLRCVVIDHLRRGAPVIEPRAALPPHQLHIPAAAVVVGAPVTPAPSSTPDATPHPPPCPPAPASEAPAPMVPPLRPSVPAPLATPPPQGADAPPSSTWQMPQPDPWSPPSTAVGRPQPQPAGPLPLAAADVAAIEPESSPIVPSLLSAPGPDAPLNGSGKAPAGREPSDGSADEPGHDAFLSFQQSMAQLLAQMGT
eukprot:GGOE01041347.1.p1 GENE.GGOE01041347.1~~GGOE01041347.1.p1  ORF type:complete len:418 (+),score=53.76 GGOE01041347.1:25-1254(+)